jgi:K+-sensing histidine kinase KdpD
MTCDPVTRFLLDELGYPTPSAAGPSPARAAVASLFEPFTRLEGKVSNGQGVGLGLSIVTSVVNAHHGHLDAEALPGGGMKISARLPKRPWAPQQMTLDSPRRTMVNRR